MELRNLEVMGAYQKYETLVQEMVLRDVLAEPLEEQAKPNIIVKVENLMGVCVSIPDPDGDEYFDEYFLVAENISGKLTVHVWATKESRGGDPTYTAEIEPGRPMSAAGAPSGRMNDNQSRKEEESE